MEAKRQFQSTQDEKPQVTDGLLAQITCEAIAARLAQDDGKDKQYMPLSQLPSLSGVHPNV
jgi:hypothetical protein